MAVCVEGASHGAARYTGDVVNGVREGRGIMTYANGEVYIGEWSAGRREGRGVYYYADDTIYDGEWSADTANGRGACRYPSGNVYDGAWHRGKVNGRGVVFYEDQDTYDGEWSDGKLHGRGVFYNKTGQVHEGQWFEDKKLSPHSSRPRDRKKQKDAVLMSPTGSCGSPMEPASTPLASRQRTPGSPTSTPRGGRHTKHARDELLSRKAALGTRFARLRDLLAGARLAPGAAVPAARFRALVQAAYPYGLPPHRPSLDPGVLAPPPGSEARGGASPPASAADGRKNSPVHPVVARRASVVYSSASSPETSDDSDDSQDRENRTRIKGIFDRIQQAKYLEGSKLTRGNLRDLILQDPEVSQLRHTLRQSQFHSWARIFHDFDESRAGEVASWNILEKEFDEDVLNRRQADPRDGKPDITISEDEDDDDADTMGNLETPTTTLNARLTTVSVVSQEGSEIVALTHAHWLAIQQLAKVGDDSVRLGGAASSAVCSAFIAQKQVLQEGQLFRQRKHEVNRRKSVNPRNFRHLDDRSHGSHSRSPSNAGTEFTDDMATEYSMAAPSDTIRLNIDDPSPAALPPNVSAWHRKSVREPLHHHTYDEELRELKGSLTRNKPHERERNNPMEPLPHGSPERAKAVEFVLSMCGQAREPFSFKQFLRVFLAMLFPFPFLPSCRCALDTTPLEREYVVSGASPRWLESPGTYLLVTMAALPVLVAMLLYSFDHFGEPPSRDGNIEPSDVYVPVIGFVLVSIASALYYSFPRRKAHPLESLPDKQFEMLANFAYCKMKEKGGVEGTWVVTWMHQSHGGKFISHRTGSTRISLVLSLLLAIAAPLHRLFDKDTMWGTNRDERIVAVLGVLAVFFSAFGLFSVVLKVIFRQSLLCQQLEVFTKLTEVSPDNTGIFYNENQFTFDLSRTGFSDPVFNVVSIQDLQNMLGWYVVRSFILYGTPVMNHNSRSAVINLNVFVVLMLSFVLIVAFMYEAVTTGYPGINDRGYATASVFLAFETPLIMYQLRLWQKVCAIFHEHRMLMASATTCRRVHALGNPNSMETDKEAALISGLAAFMTDHDYKPRCLGMKIAGRSLYLIVLFELLGVGSLIFRWIQTILT
ncbi:Phosphatidylinositol 4-phosphate 5-kinase 7 [Diplonema papillatum]|nr:Phosphatidylinositol 4-phosphate 5-kinase 7 [Diplonema papillatum]